MNQLALQAPAFRPFSSPPVRSLNSWFLGDLVVYRLYILAWTYADIALTAWLTAKATHSKKLGVLAFCLLPMMFSLWQDATGNSMYSYGALAQSTLLPVLLAGLCMLRWQDTHHMRWAVLSAFFMFMACGTFEIGFTYIAALFGVAWLTPAPARCALPCAFVWHRWRARSSASASTWGRALSTICAARGILEGQGIDIGGVSPNFDLPAVLRTWVMQMSAGFPLNAMVFGKIKARQCADFGRDLRRDVGGLRNGCPGPAGPPAHLQENLLLFLTGLALLSAPALLIGISPKYQDGINVDWRHGYIPRPSSPSAWA